MPTERPIRLSWLRCFLALLYLGAEYYVVPPFVSARADDFLARHPQFGLNNSWLPPAAMGIAAAFALGPLGVAGLSPLSRPVWGKLVGVVVMAAAAYAVSGDWAPARLGRWLESHDYRTCPTDRVLTANGQPWPATNALWERRGLYCPGER